jgi:hypothetical protein
MPTTTQRYSGSDNRLRYNYGKITDLKPLARQAYRLLLKDYYKFDPVPDKGDYLTVGQQDNYILSDKTFASRQYVPNSGRVEGLFGIPYFYFRNTYFGIPGVNGNGDAVEEDYFALVQRLSPNPETYGGNGFGDYLAAVKQYGNQQWGSFAGNLLHDQVQQSGELGVFIATVADNSTKLKIAVRGDIAVAPSTFTLERDEDPLYRRFGWNDYNKEIGRTYEDKPLVLEFHRLNNSDYKLFENGGGDKSSGGGYDYNLNRQGELHRDSLGNIISFLGIKNISQFPSVGKDDNPHGNTNYAIYVDTAFINRETGWIKPQYMLAVDVKEVPPCNVCENEHPKDYNGYTIGRYLYNTSMYAKKVIPGVTVNYDLTQPVDVDAIHGPVNGVDGYAYTRSGNTKWERLAFAWAIHYDDKLYVLKNVAPEYKNKQYDVDDLIATLAQEYPVSPKATAKGVINFDLLAKVKGKPMSELKGKTIGLHAIIDLGGGHNTHNDWVFSFRYIQRRSDDFIIESETTNRDRVNGPIIRPGYGGWVKYDNNVPIITRSDTKEALGEGYVTNVKLVTDIEPVANAPVETASGVKVVGGYGAVTVLNAAGKSVTVTNVIGQTIANTVADSDNVSVAVAANNTIVFVSVDGGTAEKVLVK